VTETRILPADDAGIAEAAALIARGETVAVPTETVYGWRATPPRARRSRRSMPPRAGPASTR
jgi:L-threonylcarbamoyladenylate synthase